TAINTMTMPTMNSIWFSPHSRRTTILTGGTVTVCALVHSASGTRNAAAILRGVEGAARSATGRAGLPRSDVARPACAFENSAVQRRSLHLKHATLIDQSHPCHALGIDRVRRRHRRESERSHELD